MSSWFGRGRDRTNNFTQAAAADGCSASEGCLRSNLIMASTIDIIEEDVSRVEVTEKRNYEKLHCLSVNRAGCGLGTAFTGGVLQHV